MHVRRWLETELGRGCVFMTGRLTQAVIAAMLSLAFSSASAERNRPPVMYPIGGQGVQGCAPIPGASSGSRAALRFLLLRPDHWVNGLGPGRTRWLIQRFGGGAAVGEPSERAAKRAAISNCE